MYSGYPGEWYARLESLQRLEYRYKIYVPGNHDFHVQNYEGVARAELRRAGVRLLIGDLIEVEGHRLLGLPWVTGLNGWAFNKEEQWILDQLELWDVPDIMVTHAPMWGVLDAINPSARTTWEQNHVGSLAYNRWFHKLDNVPRVWAHGHIHESYGRTNVRGCEFLNVAMCDRMYSQENEPMVVDL